MKNRYEAFRCVRTPLVSITVCLSLLASAAVAADDSGAALFEQHCSSCHAASGISAPLKGASEEQERATAKMREFLSRHDDADAAEARAIVEYLRQEANRK